MNSFVGPPLGSLLLGILAYLPFLFDSATFFISAALISLIVTSAIPSRDVENSKTSIDKRSFRDEIREGFSWLWKHELLRPMAIILGAMNLVGSITAATFILFAQEILGTSALEFALLGTAGAIGGTLGGIFGPKISTRIGSGPSLYITLLATPLLSLVIGITSNWYLVWLVIAITTVAAVLWNVITVSLRQSIIPANLLGRVNSVYRFFAWGSIPIGTLLGGAVVDLIELSGNRELALRAPYLLSALLGLLIFLFAAPKLTTERIEGARGGVDPA